MTAGKSWLLLKYINDVFIFSYIVNWFLKWCIRYLKTKNYYCALGQRVKDLLIMYSRWLHAGCQLIEKQQLSASCTLAGSSVLDFFFFFLETIWLLLSPWLHAHTMWKPQKASHFHSVTIDDAEAADVD